MYLDGKRVTEGTPLLRPLGAAERKRGEAMAAWKRAKENKKPAALKSFPKRCPKCVWRKKCGDYFGYERITGGAGCGSFKKTESERK